MGVIMGKTRAIFNKSVRGLAQSGNAESSTAISRVLSLFFFPFRNQQKATRNQIHISVGSTGAGDRRRFAPEPSFTRQELDSFSSIGVGLQIKAITDV